MDPRLRLKPFEVGIGVSTIVAVILAIWIGIPTFKKAQADRLVDELCRRDGGIVVYETVARAKAPGELRPRRITSKHLRKDGDEFYYVFSTKDIRGSSGSSDISALTVYRTEAALYRARDDKLLGVAVGYARRGGDAVGPWHPSSYRCPPDSDEQHLAKKVIGNW